MLKFIPFKNKTLDRCAAFLDAQATSVLAWTLRTSYRVFRKTRARYLLRDILFIVLTFRMRFRVTVWFRHFVENGALDQHLAFFCGPYVGGRLPWLLGSSFASKYPDEIAYYLFLCGYRREAVALARRDGRAVDASWIDRAYEQAGLFDDENSMVLLTQMHRLEWAYLVDRSPALGGFVRLMLEHRNFQHEERAFQRQVDSGDVPQDALAEQYIPCFFRDKGAIESLMGDFADRGGALGSSEAAGRPRSPEPGIGQAVSSDIYLFYAYRHLLLRTYHNGEGHHVPIVYRRCVEAQRRLRRTLPAPSAELKRVLDGIGVDLADVRLLSPDWSALIGHNGHLNVHLMMRQMGWWKGAPVLLAYKDRIANRAFLSLFSDICPTLTLGLNVDAGAWHELASLTPFLGDSHQAFEFEDGRTMYWNDAGAMALQKWEREGRGFPLRDIYDERLHADDRAETLYESLRRKWGMGPGDWHVCLHMRDAEARGETVGVGESIRSTAMGNYIDTIRYITSIGGWVIRMGGRKAPPLPAMPRVIDYARSVDQVPEMDIHLVRRARAFIGTTSGFAYVASSFGIPTAMVNALSSVGLLWSKDTRFALKPVHTRDGRMLSLRDVTSERWRWAFPTYETVTSAGLVVSESSSDEILETTREVLDLAGGSGGAVTTVDDAWEECLDIPWFFGNSRPARYFLEKYSGSLLAGSPS